MKVVTFYRPDPTIATPTSERYACSEAGDSGGTYVPLAEVEEMQNQVRVVIDILQQSRHAFRSKAIERARKLLEATLPPKEEP